jgi:hypothetical protein
MRTEGIARTARTSRFRRTSRSPQTSRIQRPGARRVVRAPRFIRARRDIRERRVRSCGQLRLAVGARVGRCANNRSNPRARSTLDIISLSSTNRPSPLDLHKRTRITPVTAFTSGRCLTPRGQSPLDTIRRVRRILDTPRPGGGPGTTDVGGRARPSRRPASAAPALVRARRGPRGVVARPPRAPRRPSGASCAASPHPSRHLDNPHPQTQLQQPRRHCSLPRTHHPQFPTSRLHITHTFTCGFFAVFDPKCKRSVVA